MRKLFALVFAVLLVLPAAFASRSSYDYSSNKDFEYVKYNENEHASESYSDCGYYDYDYWGRSCHSSHDRYEFSRSRNFEFGRYHEDVHTSGDFAGRSYDRYYDSFAYPDYGYDYSTPYDGGRYSSGRFSTYIPYGDY